MKVTRRWLYSNDRGHREHKVDCTIFYIGKASCIMTRISTYSMCAQVNGRRSLVCFPLTHWYKTYRVQMDMVWIWVRGKSGGQTWEGYGWDREVAEFLNDRVPEAHPSSRWPVGLSKVLHRVQIRGKRSSNSIELPQSKTMCWQRAMEPVLFEWNTKVTVKASN